MLVKVIMFLLPALATLLLGLGILKGNFLYHSHLISHFDYLSLIGCGFISGMVFMVIVQYLQEEEKGGF